MPGKLPALIEDGYDKQAWRDLVNTCGDVGTSINALGGIAALENNFYHACKKYQINCTVLGRGEKWLGWPWMVQKLRTEMRNLDPGTLVIVMDQSDILMQCSKAKIVAAFNELVPNRNKIVLQLESSFHGPPQHVNISAGIPNLQQVNGGWLMGTVEQVDKALVAMGRKDRDPQVNLGNYALANSQSVVIDQDQRFCATIVTDEWSKHFKVVNHSRHRNRSWSMMAQNKHNNVFPCFLHFPGRQERLRTLRKFQYRFAPWDEALGKLENLTLGVKAAQNCVEGSRLDQCDLSDAAGYVSRWQSSLYGTIPAASMSKRILGLDLHDNHLHGTIPPFLGSLHRLHDLHLRSNCLTGTIPASLGSLTSLVRLDLRQNQLSGAAPSSITDLVARGLLFNF